VIAVPFGLQIRMHQRDGLERNLCFSFLREPFEDDQHRQFCEGRHDEQRRQHERRTLNLSDHMYGYACAIFTSQDLVVAALSNLKSLQYLPSLFAENETPLSAQT